MNRLKRMAFGVGGLLAAALLAGWFGLRGDAYWLAVPVLGFSVLAGVRPIWAVAVLLTLWPVADLTYRTGHYYATESDALLLAVVCGIACRQAIRPLVVAEHRVVRPHVVWTLLFAILMGFLLIGCWRGLTPMPRLDDANAFTGYASHLNALRVFKGYLWVALLLPCLSAALNHAGEAGLRILKGGLLGSLLGVSLAVLVERLMFPGLLDFAADYRATAPFWETHTGGAALDAFLALTWPFALFAVVRAKRLVYALLAFCVLGVASYALLATFSRGAYAAAGLAVVVMFVAGWVGGSTAGASAGQSGGSTLRQGLRGLAGFALLMGFMSAVFSTGGYRGLLAAGMLLLAVFMVMGRRTTALRWTQWLAGLTLGLCLACVAIFAAVWWGKAAYVAHAVLFCGAMGAAWFRRPNRASRDWLCMALLVALGVNLVSVVVVWGGVAHVGALTAMLALLMLGGGLIALRPDWFRVSGVASWRNAVLLMFFAGALAVGSGSYFVESRFSTTSNDMDVRIRHWENAAGIVQGSVESLLGIGMGRFSEKYFWQLPANRFPGGFLIGEEKSEGGANRFLTLIAPHYPISWGDMFRVGQVIDSDVQGAVVVTLKARAEKAAKLNLELCERQLLYPERCATGALRIGPWPEWREMTVRLNAPAASHVGPLSPPRFFAFGLESRATKVDLDDVALLTDRGAVALANSGFEAGAPGWFFTSDREHLPWHAKNMWLALYIDAGLVAVGLLTLLSLGGLGRAVIRLGNHPLGPPLGGAIAGFLCVAAFDSLIDVPRITTLFLVTLWLTYALRVRS